MPSPRSILVLSGAVLALAFALAGPAVAERFVVVNGVRMDPDTLAALDDVACTVVPNGRYWIAPNGAWGYEGMPQVMGYVGAACAAATPGPAPAPATAPAPRRPSLSERGMLYSPYDWVR